MTEHCLNEKMRYVRGGPTCLPISLLRDMVRVFREYARNDEDKLAFRPSSVQGGRRGSHNHRTKAGLYATILETLRDLPEPLWVWPEADPANAFLQQLSVRQPWQTASVAETLRTKFFKPMFASEDRLDMDFDQGWMRNHDIEAVIHQSTKSKRSFAFLGVHTPATKALRGLLKTLHLALRQPQYRTFGVIWNTDDEDAGTHWVSALFFPRQTHYEYFDSFGHRPNRAVTCHMKAVKAEMAKFYGFAEDEWTHPPQSSVRRHQTGSTQCGMYASWFILERLSGRTFGSIQARATPDQSLCDARSRFFRKPLPAERSAMEARARAKRAVRGPAGQTGRIVLDFDSDDDDDDASNLKANTDVTALEVRDTSQTFQVELKVGDEPETTVQDDLVDERKCRGVDVRVSGRPPTKPTQSKPLTVALVGDGILDNAYYNSRDPHGLRTKDVRHFALLQLRDSKYNVVNLAVDGACVRHVVEGMEPARRLVETRPYPYPISHERRVWPLEHLKYVHTVVFSGLLPDILASPHLARGPDAVEQGLLDDGLWAQYVDAVKQLRASVARVILVSPYVPWPVGPWRPHHDTLTEVVRRFHQRLVTLARTHRLSVLHLGRSFSARRSYCTWEDSSKPSIQGGSVVAKLIAAAVMGRTRLYWLDNKDHVHEEDM